MILFRLFTRHRAGCEQVTNLDILLLTAIRSLFALDFYC